MSQTPSDSTTPGTIPGTIYVDADACPVKQEIYKVAERHGWTVQVVANDIIALPVHPLIKRVVVDGGFDAADDWIAERAGPGDVVITADVPLASRCVTAGAAVLGHNGKAFSERSIGMQLATRNLMAELREAGQVTGGPRPFSPRDRSAFLSALHETILRIARTARSPTGRSPTAR
ncbi:YaiI/YqxD family protein [Pelagibius sp.]|uniref:YaiI/YqxD family protein n=1 Tax=Pelagibius sp. TaxID=1931238 RepID=UPI003B50673A